jgi:outer membrane protein OmpA-like peptidoglycan-associated protein
MIRALLLAAVFLFLPLFLIAQNLVLNPSFEETNHCITEADVSKYDNVPSLLLSQCKSWASFSEEGTADLIQPCNQWSVAAASERVKARTGKNYAGFYAFDHGCCNGEYREYLVGKLKGPLTKGENYKVSFFLSLTEKSNYATSSIGVYFSPDSVYRSDNFYGVAPFIPQIQNPKGQYVSEKKQWKEIELDYKAQGGEQFLVIGDFLYKPDTIAVGGKTKRELVTYYYIDDVCVSAKNCNTPIVLPKYGFRIMATEEGSNMPIVGASAEMISTESSTDRKLVKTEIDGKARFNLPENEYLLFFKADCYLPVMGFYNVPVIKQGSRLPEQMQYLSLTKQEKGAKVILDETFPGTIPEMQTKNSDRLPDFFMKMDKLAEFLKENPSLKISLNAGINYRYISTDAKKEEIKEKQNANLLFMQNYWFEKGVKKDQVTTKIIELSTEHPSVSGYVERSYIGGSSNRYEIEVTAANCKSSGDKPEEQPVNGSFFHKNEVGSVYILDKVFFTPDSPELKKNSYEELDRLLGFLQQNPNLKVRINGHTDIGKTNGSDEFLQQLSDERAKAVADYLISKGADARNISWKGYANRKPIADNNTEAGKAQNRRVEVEILEF